MEDVATSAIQAQPHSRQAEEAVLGSILIDSEAYFNVAQFLQPDDFYIVRNRWIWESFSRLHERRAPIDYLTVCEELEQQSQLAEAGGPAYVMSLINQTPSSLNAEAYGRLVEENSVRRRMLTAANDLARLAYDQKQSVDTIMDEAEKSIFSISERRVRHDLQPIQQVLSEVYDRIDQLSRRDEEILGVPTGLYDLDKLLGGLQKSDLLIVAGRPGMGKTGFMLSIMKNAAQRYKKHVAMFSLEMSNEQLVQRLIAQETGIDTQRLRTGKLLEDEIPLFTHAIEVLGDTHIYLDDTPAITPMQLRTKCRRLHMEYELDLILVDYLQLMSSDMRTDNRVQEVSYISRNLKVLARELNVPVLTAAQLSRAVEQRADKRPVLSDLRESGCLTGETLVTLANGSCAPIKSLVGKTPEIVTLNDRGQIVIGKSSRVWFTGHRPVFRMTTATGRTIRATGNHPFRVFHGWEALENLKVGDRIALPRKNIRMESAVDWSDAQVILLAHMIGDGCYVSRQPLHYTSTSQANLDIVSDSASSAFGITGRLIAQENWYHLYLSAGANKWHPNPIRQWFRALGIDGQRSPEKIIPEQVFMLPAHQVSLFLRHLWATDGSIYLRKTAHGHSATIYYATSSEVLARQVQQLLTHAGIQSRIHTADKKGYRRNYHVHVSGRDEQLNFALSIGAFGDRVAALADVVHFLMPSKSNPNRDTLPRDVWTQVKSRMKELGITQREMASMRGTSYGGYGHFGFAPTRNVLSSYAVLLDDPNLYSVLAEEIYWDEIVQIVPDGEEDVYDMTVPDTHNFVANGIIVHNSLEQDADIVMFIHRPDAMEKDSPKANIAEIIVGKHRNGPTHPGIELVFLNNLARFENAAPPPGRK